MGNDTQSVGDALQCMLKWAWLKCDPDGTPFSPGIDLNEAVNRLAMAGFVKPQSLILALLLDGELLSFGCYKWRKYQWGSFYDHERHYGELDRRQWRALADSIKNEAAELANHGWPFFKVDLEKLELNDCDAYEWSFSNSRFSVALCPPDTPLTDRSYFEEWFSAWEITVIPRAIQEVEDSESFASAAPIGDKGGRPMAEWWPDFVAELIAYVSEVGLPQGIGHQGQSEIIKDVFGRMQARDKGEPSRSQVQETVNAVLRRMRTAGN